ncbi:uncharacterized [Tachysurus ichikawai]
MLWRDSISRSSDPKCSALLRLSDAKLPRGMWLRNQTNPLPIIPPTPFNPEPPDERHVCCHLEHGSGATRFPTFPCQGTFFHEHRVPPERS